MPLIDVLIPTSKHRLHGLLSQIRSALNQPYDIRVTVAMGTPWEELRVKLSHSELEYIRFIHNAPEGHVGGPANLYCLEKFNWGDWIYSTGDDDVIFPWTFKHFMDNSANVSMVVGGVSTYTKDDHLHHTMKVGHTLEYGKVTGPCVLYKANDLLALDKPYFDPTNHANDFELITKMAAKYKYRIIPNVVCGIVLDTLG